MPPTRIATGTRTGSWSGSARSRTRVSNARSARVPGRSRSGKPQPAGESSRSLARRRHDDPDANPLGAVAEDDSVGPEETRRRLPGESVARGVPTRPNREIAKRATDDLARGLVAARRAQF